ncbi:MAG: hypothetical protein WAT39_19635, partial [Planctomycetota bacterium]
RLPGTLPLARAADAARADVLVAGDADALAAAVLVGARGTAALYDASPYQDSERDDLANELECALLARTAAIVVCDEAEAARLRQRCAGVSPFVVHDFPDLPPAIAGDRQQLRQQHGLPLASRLLAVVLGPGGRGDCGALLAALARRAADDVGVVVLSATAAAAHRVRTDAAAGGLLGGRVFVTDPVPATERAAIAAACDGAIVLGEGPGDDGGLSHQALFTALAAELPILAADTPANRHLVVEQGVGMVAPMDDAAAIAAAIERFCAADHAPFLERAGAIGPACRWSYEVHKLQDALRSIARAGGAARRKGR